MRVEARERNRWTTERLAPSWFAFDGEPRRVVGPVQRPPTRVSQMVLVQNWVEELKARVPAK